MGKMRNAIIMVLIIEISLYLFVKTGYSLTSLLEMLFNIELYEDTKFLTWLIPSLAVGATVITIGIVTGKVDWVWRATLAAVMLTFFVSIIHLATFIYSQDYWGEAKGIVTVLAILPFAIYYLFTLVEYVSTGT